MEKPNYYTLLPEAFKNISLKENEELEKLIVSHFEKLSQDFHLKNLKEYLNEITRYFK